MNDHGVISTKTYCAMFYLSTILAFLLLGLAGVVGQDLVEEAAAGGLLEEVDDRVVHRVAVLVQPSGLKSISVAMMPASDRFVTLT